MKTVKVKTADLRGTALDWAVAIAIGQQFGLYAGSVLRVDPNDEDEQPEDWSPSTDWSQGGPLIEKYISGIDKYDGELWWAKSDRDGWDFLSESILVSVCRAVVSSRLGGEVEVPQDLVS